MSRGAKAVALTLGRGTTEKTLWLEYNVDALAMLEELLDQDIEQIVEQLATNKRLGFTRAVLWAGLQEHQPTIALKPAGELLALPGADEVVGLRIIEAINKAFPDPEAIEAPADPPQTPAA